MASEDSGQTNYSRPWEDPAYVYQNPFLSYSGLWDPQHNPALAPYSQQRNEFEELIKYLGEQSHPTLMGGHIVGDEYDQKSRRFQELLGQRYDITDPNRGYDTDLGSRLLQIAPFAMAGAGAAGLLGTGATTFGAGEVAAGGAMDMMGSAGAGSALGGAATASAAELGTGAGLASIGAGGGMETGAGEMFGMTGMEGGANAAIGGGAVGGASAAGPIISTAGSNLWTDIFSPALKSAGLTPGVAAVGIAQYLLNRGLASDYNDAMNKAMQLAKDPASGEYPFYQGELRKLWTDPNYLQTNPGFLAGLDQVNRMAAQRGQSWSGNKMGDLINYGMNKQMDLSRTLQPLAGFGANNFGAGQIAAQQAGGQIGLKQDKYGDIGVLAAPVLKKAGDWLANQVFV